MKSREYYIQRIMSIISDMDNATLEALYAAMWKIIKK